MRSICKSQMLLHIHCCIARLSLWPMVGSLYPAEYTDIFADKRLLFLRNLRSDQRKSAGKIKLKHYEINL